MPQNRLALAVALFGFGCTLGVEPPQAEPDAAAGSPDSPDAGTPITDPLDGLPTGAEQWMNLCAKGYADTVSQAFCNRVSPPSITSLAELRAFVGLGGQFPTNLAITGVFHSTAVTGRHVTPLNPRMFLMTQTTAPINPTTPQPMPTYNIIAFSRGEPFVELASKDTVTGEPRFFLLRFNLPCESAAQGCTLADLLTPTTESGWTGYSLYDDETIENTTLDCLRCHQPSGPATSKFLRMQELRNPWNHWFYEEIPKNDQAIKAFEEAHAGELYADIPVHLYRGSRPNNLQKIIQNNGPLNQPNEYNSGQINMELQAGGTSATWNAVYAEVVAGRAIPVPFTDNPQTDPAKLAAMKQAYLDTVNGILPRDQLPDVREVFLDAAIDVVYRPKPGLDAQGIFVQICSQCHNSRLNQAISRASFNVDALAQLPRSVKDAAIVRLQLGDENIRKMPPARFYTLSDAERDLLIEELSK